MPNRFSPRNRSAPFLVRSSRCIRRILSKFVSAIVDQLKQQYGCVHGGVLSFLADNTLTFAGGLRLSGQIVTAEYKINYLRPALGTELVARGQVLSAGSSQAVTRCEVYMVLDGNERLCAAAQGTITVRRG